jgi:YidC/Oxa1 family membrane protein insertase
MKFSSSLKLEWKELERFDKSSDEDRSIVFYVENEHYTIYLKSLIETLVNEYGLKVSYVTSSKTDPLLKSTNKNISSFYIGDGVVRTKFFLNLKAKILIMTMPDLETFHIKKSKVYPVHYVYLFHSMVSTHLVYRRSAFEHFDSIFCVGNYQLDEIRSTEKLYDLKPKNLIRYGYSHLDNLLEKYSKRILLPKNNENKLHILLAPSWSDDGLFENFGEKVIDILLREGYKVTFRPHPMTQKKSKKKINRMSEKFSKNESFLLEQNIFNFDSFLLSDIMITDWSGAALEFAFAFEKPVLFIDVPKKINNPEYEKIPQVPIEVSIREKIGKIILPTDLELIPNEIKMLYGQTKELRDKITKIRNELIFNVGESKKDGAEEIIKLLNERESYSG